MQAVFVRYLQLLTLWLFMDLPYACVSLIMYDAAVTVMISVSWVRSMM